MHSNARSPPKRQDTVDSLQVKYLNLPNTKTLGQI